MKNQFIFTDEALTAELRDCADSNDELGCYNVSGSATYICNATLCNDHNDCTSIPSSTSSTRSTSTSTSRCTSAASRKTCSIWHSTCYHIIMIMLIMTKIN